MKLFSLDQRVEWVSQASGVTSQKTGRIVQIVPPGQKPFERFTNLYRNRGVQTVNVRKHESYVVDVGGRFYWPRVSALQPVAEMF